MKPTNKSINKVKNSDFIISITKSREIDNDLKGKIKIIRAKYTKSE
jgi:hypothetical protein